MAKVNFNLSPNSDKDSDIEFIRLVFRYDTPTKRLVYNVGQGVPRTQWNLKRQRANVTRATPQYQELNSNLDKIQNEVLKISTTYQLNGEALSIEQFKKELDIALGKTERSFQKTSLFDFIDTFIQNRIELGNQKGTVAKFKQIRTHLKDFAKKRKLDFEHLTLEFFDDFLKYLYSKNFKQNSVHKLIQVLKTILNDATEKGYNSNMDFKKKKFGTHTEKVQSIYLNQSELKELFEFDLSGNTRLEKVRDLFILESFTGLRFSDGQKFEPENIIKDNGKEFVRIKTQKTGQEIVIPMHPMVRTILDKYNNVLPEISNQKMNDYIKEVGELVGFDEKTIITATRGGKRIDTVHSKFELITSHTARRSFATNAFIMKVPTLSIMMITGHTTESSFMKYIKISNMENAVLMSEHAFFRGETVEPHQL